MLQELAVEDSQPKRILAHRREALSKKKPALQIGLPALNSERVPMKVLITGGAGFIGSHVADELLATGYEVRALDNLSSQVHGADQKRPEYLNREVELICGDVRDREAVRKALQGVGAVFHLAAMVGVGQSMYEISEYTSVNNFGTAVLLQELIDRPAIKLIIASSMSVYGEGLYRDADGNVQSACERDVEQLRAGEWEPRGSDGQTLIPVPTPETKAAQLSSIYALSKFDQERMCLIAGQAYGIKTTGLRFFNVYGPRQALSNPYTGVLAIFGSRLLNGNRPMIFEDGLQKRDFVSVYDIAHACRLALESPDASGKVFNIGSGQGFSVREVAEKMAAVMQCPEITPDISGRYRVGDIRHCFADISLAEQILHYKPQITFERGLRELAGWLEGQQSEDRVSEACAELSVRGLTI
jgi:dTDP-L-rhamnose 4-epimerase